MAGGAGGMALIQPGWLAVRALRLPVRALAARARALPALQRLSGRRPTAPDRQVPHGASWSARAAGAELVL